MSLERFCVNCYFCEVLDEDTTFCDIDGVPVNPRSHCDRFEFYPELIVP